MRSSARPVTFSNKVCCRPLQSTRALKASHKSACNLALPATGRQAGDARAAVASRLARCGTHLGRRADTREARLLEKGQRAVLTGAIPQFGSTEQAANRLEHHTYNDVRLEGPRPVPESFFTTGGAAACCAALLALSAASKASVTLASAASFAVLLAGTILLLISAERMSIRSSCRPSCRHFTCIKNLIFSVILLPSFSTNS
mmetsp:Transcript_1555/g.6149  ORF Transcript_1555/g.6149 Transcript_1555/m.6149 type:complete len:202 (-) Transcript_1555:687-1292(-)